VLFDTDSPHYTGKVITRKAYKVASVRSSSGHEQVRYRVDMTIRMNGRRIRGIFNLSDRSRNTYPVLIGRRTLTNKFIVDVSQHEYKYKEPPKAQLGLNEELIKNPQKFHKKYHSKYTKK
jgi:hypothetical protein